MTDIRIPVGPVEVTVRRPDITPAQRNTTVGLCSSATLIWLGASLIPYADLSLLTVLAAFGVPWGVGLVTVLAVERRAHRDLAAAQDREGGQR